MSAFPNNKFFSYRHPCMSKQSDTFIVTSKATKKRESIANQKCKILTLN